MQHSEATLLFYTYRLLTTRNRQRIKRITYFEAGSVFETARFRPHSLLGGQHEGQKGQKIYQVCFFQPPPFINVNASFSLGVVVNWKARPTLPFLVFSFVYLSYLSTWKVWKEKAGNLSFPVRPFKKNAVLRQKGEGNSHKKLFLLVQYLQLINVCIGDWFLD